MSFTRIANRYFQKPFCGLFQLLVWFWQLLPETGQL